MEAIRSHLQSLSYTRVSKVKFRENTKFHFAKILRPTNYTLQKFCCWVVIWMVTIQFIPWTYVSVHVCYAVFHAAVFGSPRNKGRSVKWRDDKKLRRRLLCNWLLGVRGVDSLFLVSAFRHLLIHVSDSLIDRFNCDFKPRKRIKQVPWNTIMFRLAGTRYETRSQGRHKLVFFSPQRKCVWGDEDRGCVFD